MAGCAALPRCVENRTDQNSTRRSAAWSGEYSRGGRFRRRRWSRIDLTGRMCPKPEMWFGSNFRHSPVTIRRGIGLLLCCPLTTKLKGYPFEVLLADSKPSAALADRVKPLDWQIIRAGCQGRTHTRSVIQNLWKSSDAEPGQWARYAGTPRPSASAATASGRTRDNGASSKRSAP